MALPKLQYPVYEVQLLSQTTPTNFRPFTVREEKLLLMAAEAKDLESTIQAMKQIITNCVVSALDIDNLPMIDMETLFLHLRARSIGEQGKTYFTCKNEIKEGGQIGDVVVPIIYKECGMPLEVSVDFLQIPMINTDRDKHIKFDEKVGVKMKYPSFSLFKDLKDIPAKDMEMAIAASCLDIIYDEDSVHQASDCTGDELIQFLFDLPGDKYELVRQFMENTPKHQLVTKKVCPKCGWDHTLTLEGIVDFFV
jgi:hypothetical protein